MLQTQIIFRLPIAIYKEIQAKKYLIKCNPKTQHNMLLKYMEYSATPVKAQIPLTISSGIPDLMPIL